MQADLVMLVSLFAVT